MQNECGKSLVDSNILVYLADSEDAQRQELALRWLRESANKIIFVSAQNLREFAFRALIKSAPPEKIIDFIDSFTAKFTVLQDDQLDTKNAIELCKGDSALFWDASIVSVMKRNGIDCILTENTKDFRTLGVKAINPLK